MGTDLYGGMRLEIRRGREGTRKIPVSMRPADFLDASLRTYPYKSVPLRISGDAGETSPGCGKPRLRFFVSRLLKKEPSVSHAENTPLLDQDIMRDARGFSFFLGCGQKNGLPLDQTGFIVILNTEVA